MGHDRQLHILDVGHGNSAVLVDDDGVVVIDAGPNNTLLEFLLQEKIERIEVVLISHADADHIRGLLALVASESVSIGRIYINSDSQKTSDLWQELLYTLDVTHQQAGGIICRTSLHVGMDDELRCGRVKIEVLAPSFYLAGLGPGAVDNRGNRLTSNTVSAVLRLSQDDEMLALLPGDIDTIGLGYLLRTQPNPHAHIAVFPHHGGRPGRTGQPAQFAYDFANAVQSNIMLFSIGRGGNSKNPRKDVVNAVKTALPNVKIACTQLSEHCDTRSSFSMTHLSRSFAKGREQQISCAGSLFIDLDNRPIQLHPLDKHAAFVSSTVNTPLCQRTSTVVLSTIDIIVQEDV